MNPNFAGKRVLILSDSEGLSRAVELNLSSYLEVIRLPIPSLKQQGCQAQAGSFDLIVVALCLPTSEPVVALSRASLADRIGQVPLLIISGRPFHSEPDDKITHLDFPFNIEELHNTVKGIVSGRPII